MHVNSFIDSTDFNIVELANHLALCKSLGVHYDSNADLKCSTVGSVHSFEIVEKRILKSNHISDIVLNMDEGVLLVCEVCGLEIIAHNLTIST